MVAEAIVSLFALIGLIVVLLLALAGAIGILHVIERRNVKEIVDQEDAAR